MRSIFTRYRVFFPPHGGAKNREQFWLDSVFSNEHISHDLFTISDTFVFLDRVMNVDIFGPSDGP